MPSTKATLAHYEAVAKRIVRIWGVDGPGPVVVRDWDGPGRHAVCWEGGPYQWPMLLDGGRDAEFGISYKEIPAPKGFFLGPYNHYAVGIWPV